MPNNSAIKQLYEELYDCFDDIDNGLGQFVACKGEKYGELTIRLMVVGRACNGWEPRCKEYNLEKSKQNLGIAAQKDFDCNANMEWYKQQEAKITKTKFWISAKCILEELTQSDFNDDNWVDYIVWSNLYKVAPLNRNNGNPNNKQCKAQREVCKKILKYEIEYFKPTHILFITGLWCDWFDALKIKDYKQIFFNNKRNVKTVELSGEYITNLGLKTKMVVANRTEYCSNSYFEQWIKDVIKEFD